MLKSLAMKHCGVILATKVLARHWRWSLAENFGKRLADALLQKNVLKSSERMVTIYQ